MGDSFVKYVALLKIRTRLKEKLLSDHGEKMWLHMIGGV